MDDDVATARNSPAADSSSTNRRLLLLLTLSPARKVIAKHHRARLADGGAFQCRTCGRRFATFQALGGHRTSHNRPRVRADGLDLLLGARPGKGTTATDVHRCNTCGMVFATGQALGGHMRRHRAALLHAAALETTTMSAWLSEEGDDDENDASHVSTSTLIQFI